MSHPDREVAVLPGDRPVVLGDGTVLTMTMLTMDDAYAVPEADVMATDA
jgi:hypothetical protein